MDVHDAGSLPSPEELLLIGRARIGAAVVLGLNRGGRQRHGSPAAGGCARRAAAARRRPVVIDMTEVTFLSSARLGALVEAHREADRRSEPLRVVVDHTRPVLRPLQLSGLDQMLTLFRFLDIAVARDPGVEGHNGDAGDIDATS